MQALLLRLPRTALELTALREPRPQTGELLVKVGACGVCRTDLHVIDGELSNPRLPLIPGHEIVGTVAEVAAGVDAFNVGDRVGIPWLGYTCGVCSYCTTGRENLCDAARFTGYTIDGGYAEYTVAIAFECRPVDRTLNWRRGCAPDSSAIARSAWQVMGGA
jgi:alcohol dehydrogenase, propanol-preferring